ncbi:MAG TPA: envelope stress response membrane protein PspB [Stellaceae bacterium]|nr:envelope stress response membrane protein PspB [Stellaceae bacterium]
MEGVEIIILCFVVVVMPIWLALHYATQFRRAKILSGDNEKSLVELAEIADRLQARIDNLERLMDAAAPEWRTKP